MLIRSQDKHKLVSFDNINFLEIQPMERDELQSTEFEIWATTETDFVTIGKYSTQEKAEAVMDDIEASALNYDHAKASGDNLFSYLMPADDDPWFDRRGDNESNISAG